MQVMSQERFADACYKEVARRMRGGREVYMHTIEDMTPLHRMDRSHKFNLSVDVASAGYRAGIDAVFHALSGDAEPLTRLLDVSVPPFEHTWIDMDALIPVLEKGTEGVESALVGFLLHRAPKSFVADICLALVRDDAAGALIDLMPISFLIAPRGDELPYVDARTWMPLDPSLSEDDERVPLPRVWYRVRSYENIPKETAPEFAVNFLSLLVGSLALVNVAPTVKEAYRPSGALMVGAKRRPYYAKTKIRVDVSPARLRRVMRAVASGRCAPRRHAVRGHFRHYLDADGALRRRVWIRDHMRGDATIGFVRQDHEVVAGRGRAAVNPLVFEDALET